MISNHVIGLPIPPLPWSGGGSPPEVSDQGEPRVPRGPTVVSTRRQDVPIHLYRHALARLVAPWVPNLRGDDPPTSEGAVQATVGVVASRCEAELDVARAGARHVPGGHDLAVRLHGYRVRFRLRAPEAGDDAAVSAERAVRPAVHLVPRHRELVDAARRPGGPDPSIGLDGHRVRLGDAV